MGRAYSEQARRPARRPAWLLPTYPARSAPRLERGGDRPGPGDLLASARRVSLARESTARGRHLLLPGMPPPAPPSPSTDRPEVQGPEAAARGAQGPHPVAVAADDIRRGSSRSAGRTVGRDQIG